MTTTLLDLKPAQIKPHPSNPRKVVGDVSELADSIKALGVLEPLIVAPNGTPDTYTLIAGERRLAAAKKARSKTVPALLRDDLADEASQIEAMLVENLQRVDLTPVEEATSYQQLLEFPGYTQQRIAKATGRNLATIRGRLKLAKLPRSALTRIQEGQINLTEAMALVEFTDDPAAYRRLEKAAGTDMFGRELKDARERRQRDKRAATKRKQLEAAGVRVIDPPAYTANVRRLYGDGVIADHRDCPGFAAYIEASYYGAAGVTYVCDQPDLHTQQEEDAEDARRRETAAAARTQLTQDATVRRTFLGTVLAKPREGLALDLLRQFVHLELDFAWIDQVLGAADKKARHARIDTLDLEQLAVLVDLSRFEYQERALETAPSAWSEKYYAEWRTRLAAVYGYSWSAHEQQMLDKAAADEDVDDGADLIGDAADDEVEQ